MPVKKTKGGYRVVNTRTKKPMTKKKAAKQLAAIKIKQKKRTRRGKSKH
jgi:hypothetical protein|tara:strand:+ start:2169 stop:2315 length:147 start_codon:yes stop_codon:yes gene_type:complete